MNKKIMGICGAISSFVGWVLWLSAQSVISTNTRYTWEPPYTAFEAEHIFVRAIGLFLLISGLLDLGLLIASRFYNSKTVKDPNSNEITTTKCPKCGLSVHKTVTLCPKCKTKINEYGGE